MGKPAIVSAKCVADIAKFQIEVKGGIIASVMNIFKDQVSAHLKPLLERELCKRAKEFLLNDVNAKLVTFPVRAPIHQAFILDYGLVADPVVASDYLETALKGKLQLLELLTSSPRKKSEVDLEITLMDLVFQAV